MYFEHSSEIWDTFPELVPGVVHVEGVNGDVSVGDRTERFWASARARLADGSEAEFPEIQAWRRTFSKMGLKPTQYRCASESLLRRFRKEDELPTIHPLIDLCNAIAIAYAIPIAVFDVSHIDDHLEVRYATGDETYLTFSGEEEHPDIQEIIFADRAGRAHARRWTNRQSRSSAVSADTTTVLIVAEAMHATAAHDIADLVNVVADELAATWQATPTKAILSASSPRFIV